VPLIHCIIGDILLQAMPAVRRTLL